MLRRARRITHVVQAIEEGNQRVIFAGELFCLCDVKRQPVGDAGLLCLIVSLAILLLDWFGWTW